MLAEALDGGFQNGPIEAARAFRQIMTVMARPGKILQIEGATPPSPLSVAAGTLIATLCDHETPLHLAPSVDTPATRGWITFHTGAPLCAPVHAQFAVGRWEEFDIDAYPIGTPEYPDRSATLIVETRDLKPSGAKLRGPGIKDTATLSLPETAAFIRNQALFPLGLDFFFTDDTRIAALPRTTKVS